jgi:predicted alpha/beta hydrolase family esterase
MVDCRVLLLPGWLNSDPDHWQSRWERSHGWLRVEQDDWIWPRRGDWMARLDEALLESAQPAVLVAHSLGCHLVASWRTHSRYIDRVRAALLVAPPDVERSDMPPQLHSWRPMARQLLPFTSLVVCSSNDPFCDPGRAAQMAQAWGAKLHALGAHGHINADSGLGDWVDGQSLVGLLRERSRTIAPW